MRRYKDLLNELLSDLGGAASLSLAEYELAKAAALQMFLLNEYGGQIMQEFNEDGDLSRFKAKRLTRTTTALTRILRLLGVKRRSQVKTVMTKVEAELRLKTSGIIIDYDSAVQVHKQLERQTNAK